MTEERILQRLIAFGEPEAAQPVDRRRADVVDIGRIGDLPEAVVPRRVDGVTADVGALVHIVTVIRARQPLAIGKLLEACAQVDHRLRHHQIAELEPVDQRTIFFSVEQRADPPAQLVRHRGHARLLEGQSRSSPCLRQRGVGRVLFAQECMERGVIRLAVPGDVKLFAAPRPPEPLPVGVLGDVRAPDPVAPRRVFDVLDQRLERDACIAQPLLRRERLTLLPRMARLAVFAHGHVVGILFEPPVGHVAADLQQKYRVGVHAQQLLDLAVQIGEVEFVRPLPDLEKIRDQREIVEPGGVGRVHELAARSIVPLEAGVEGPEKRLADLSVHLQFGAPADLDEARGRQAGNILRRSKFRQRWIAAQEQPVVIQPQHTSIRCNRIRWSKIETILAAIVRNPGIERDRPPARG